MSLLMLPFYPTASLAAAGPKRERERERESRAESKSEHLSHNKRGTRDDVCHLFSFLRNEQRLSSNLAHYNMRILRRSSAVNDNYNLLRNIFNALASFRPANQPQLSCVVHSVVVSVA